MTLEDETGNTNVILWQAVREKFRRALLEGKLLIIKGTEEKSPEGLIHLVAGYTTDESAALRALPVESRDFH